MASRYNSRVSSRHDGRAQRASQRWLPLRMLMALALAVLTLPLLNLSASADDGMSTEGDSLAVQGETADSDQGGEAGDGATPQADPDDAEAGDPTGDRTGEDGGESRDDTVGQEDDGVGAPATGSSEPSTASLSTGPPARRTAARETDVVAPELEPAGAVPALLAAPVTATGGFEIDGDTAADNGGDDWDTTGTRTSDGADDAGNFQGSSKEFGHPSGWTTAAGVATDKADLVDVFTHNTTYGGDVWSFFGFTRAATTGTTAYDVEFNQAPNSSADPPRPNRTPGDLLVQLVQEGNSSFDVQQAFVWTLQSDPAWDRDCVDVPGYEPAAGWCAIAVPASAFVGVASDDGSFAEGALNITELFGDGTCRGNFGTLNIRSRASDATTAALKDWVEPVGVDVPGTCAELVIEKRDEAGRMLAGATFDITPDPTPGAGASTLRMTDGTVPFDAGSIADGVADGVITIDPAEPGQYTVTEVDAPDGYLLPPAGTGPGLRTQVATVGENGSLTFAFTDPEPWLPLTVRKTATARYDVTYDWSVEKTVGLAGEQNPDDTASQNVPEGSTAPFRYGVTVAPGAESRSNYRVSGTVEVDNPNDRAMVATLTDTLADGTVCAFPDATDVEPGNPGLQVAVGADDPSFDYVCRYPGSPTASTGSNTATLTWSLADYPQTQAHVDSPQSAGTASASGSARYAFEVGEETDKTITVTDTRQSWTPAWTVTWTPSLQPQTRTYDLTFSGVPGECRDYDNTARVLGDGQTVLDEASATATVCVGADLDVAKVADLTFERTYDWDIEKSGPGTVVVGETVDPRTGAKTTTAEVTYDVVVSTDGYTDTDQTLGGTITVHNPNVWQDVVADVSDTVTIDGVVIGCAIVGGGNDRTVPRATEAGSVVVPGELTLTYTCDGVAQGQYDGTNTVTVEWDAATHATPHGSAGATVDVTVGDDAEPLNETITVSDPMAPPGTFRTLDWHDVEAAGGEHTFRYTRTLATAPGECTPYDNTATIDQTGQSSTATVTVCSPEVSKTAQLSYVRTYDWAIDKRVDRTSANVPTGGSATFDYQLEVTPSGYTDGDWALSGTIAVSNPDRSEDLVVEVTDVVDIPGAQCTVAGGTAVALAAGQSEVLSYECTLPADFAMPSDNRVNTAMVSWDGRQVTDEADVAVELVDEVNETVTVTDSRFTPAQPWTVSWPDGETFEYSLEFAGVAGKCTSYDNTGRVIGEGAEVLDADDATVEVCVLADLSVEASEDASYDRTYDWEIAKSVDSTSVEITEDGTAVFDYALEVSPDGYVDDDFELDGSITVSNPNAYTDVVVDILHDVDLPGVDCVVVGGQDVVVPAATAHGPGQLSVEVECDVDDLAQSDYTGHEHTATVEWEGPAGPRSATDTEDVEFEVEDEVNETVTVTDSRFTPAQPWTVSWPDGETFEYSLEFAGVAGKCTSYDNTGRVIGESEEVLDADDATVEVCVQKDLVVAKVVEASYDRTYLWDITKVADRTSITSDRDTATVNYTVEAVPGEYVDSGWEMTGSVTVSNPNAYKDVEVDITDTPGLGEGVACALDDGQDMVVAAGGTGTFTYTCSFDSRPDYEGTNAATVTWAPLGQGGAGGEVTTSVPVVFDLDEEMNETVTVTDDMADPSELGRATWNADGQPTTFRYAVDHAVPSSSACDTYVNTATIVETDQQAQAEVDVCGVDTLPTEEKEEPAPEAKPKARPEAEVLPETGAPAGAALWGTLGGLALLLGAWLMLKGRKAHLPRH